MRKRFRVGLTREFLTANSGYDLGLELLDKESRVSYEVFRESLPDVAPQQLTGFDALILGGHRLTRSSLSGTDLTLSIVARLGVGYDNIDVEALTERDIILTNTPDGVRRPMAVAIVTLILALSHELIAKDRFARQGEWADRLKILGQGLTGRVVGTVGVGNIGKELFRLLRPLDMIHLAADPYEAPERLAELGVKLVNLETLMRQSDFVCINCPLMPETRGLIGEREIGWMKPTAYLINTARGPIVDEAAVTRALQQRRIRGAGLDVFRVEPPNQEEPLFKLDNVILAPHSLGITDQLLKGVGTSTIRSILNTLRGDIASNVVNREVLDHPGFRAKLEANRKRWSST